jgi:hypothetical protein
VNPVSRDTWELRVAFPLSVRVPMRLEMLKDNASAKLDFKKVLMENAERALVKIPIPR